MRITIDRCICRNRRFDEMKRRADASGEVRTVEDLQELIAFGDGCGLCKPYVRRMLETGETVFHEILSEEDGQGR